MPRVLTVEWGGRGEPSSAREADRLALSLGPRKRLSAKDLAQVKEWKRERLTLKSSQDGGIGPSRAIMYETSWAVLYSPQRVVFRESSFSASDSTEELAPWQIPVSHMQIVGEVARGLFGAHRFKGVRLYGDRHIDSGARLHLVTLREKSSREKRAMVFDEADDAKLMVLLARVLDKTELETVSDEVLVPRVAYKRAPSGVSGPTALMDLARENSMRQRYRLDRLKAQVKRGREAKVLIDRIEREAKSSGITP